MCADRSYFMTSVAPEHFRWVRVSTSNCTGNCCVEFPDVRSSTVSAAFRRPGAAVRLLRDSALIERAGDFGVRVPGIDSSSALTASTLRHSAGAPERAAFASADLSMRSTNAAPRSCAKHATEDLAEQPHVSRALYQFQLRTSGIMPHSSCTRFAAPAGAARTSLFLGPRRRRRFGARVASRKDIDRVRTSTRNGLRNRLRMHLSSAVLRRRGRFFLVKRIRSPIQPGTQRAAASRRHARCSRRRTRCACAICSGCTAQGADVLSAYRTLSIALFRGTPTGGAPHAFARGSCMESATSRFEHAARQSTLL